jgi:signal peptidase I
MKSEYTDWLARLRATAAETAAPITAFFKRKDVKAVVDWLKEPVYAVALMFALTTIIAQPFYVPSGSMEPTLAIGDAVLAAKFPYGYDRYSIPFVNGPSPKTRLFGHLPKVGDVVVFRLPRDTSITFVKRVIGLPGDHIQMIQGHLWINGKELPLREAGLAENEDEFGNITMMPTYIETLPNGRKHRIFKKQWDGMMDNTDVYVVPPGCIFMMGDNRDNSLDSRWSVDQGGVGYVPLGNLVGRAFIVIGSVDFKNAGSIFEWPFQFRFSRILHGIH